jgi:hypothetical protein
MVDGWLEFRQSVVMDKSWNYRGVVKRLAIGFTFEEAARCSSISRQAVWKRIKKSPDFREAVEVAREAGRKVRDYRLWIRHPFRGKRPPSGKGHGGTPRYRYGFCPR